MASARITLAPRISIHLILQHMALDTSILPKDATTILDYEKKITQILK